MRFVLIDKLLSLERGRALASKRFDASEEFFADHFPGFAVVPGVLLTECMAQTGSWLIAHARGLTVKTTLAIIEGARFRRFARPGDLLEIEALLENDNGGSAQVSATIRCGGERVATAQLVYTVHSLDGDGPLANEETRRFARETFALLDGPRAAQGPA